MKYLFSALILGCLTLHAVEGTVAATAKYRAATEGEIQELTVFVERIHGLYKAEKYTDLARNELDYQQKIPDDQWAKIIPNVTRKLEGQRKMGGMDLLETVLKNKSYWFILSDGTAALCAPEIDPPANYRFVICSKDESKKWRLRHITQSVPKELEGVKMK